MLGLNYKSKNQAEKLQVFEIQDAQGQSKPMTLKIDGNKIDILTLEFLKEDGVELVMTETK